MRPKIVFCFLSILLVAAALAWTSAFAGLPCQSLTSLPLPDAAITVVESVPAGNYTAPNGQVLTNVPAFCRVHGVANPVPGSNIGFEVWMPVEGWKGKVIMLGNGGYSSNISFGSMPPLMAKGYATVGTDTGHTGDDPIPFVQGAANPEIIVDWGHRAVHESIVNAKMVVAAFYGSQPGYSYFTGCSTGGHQAFSEAQRYPEDFDGIIAGAPGHNRTHLNAGFLWQFIQNHLPGNNSQAAQIIPSSKLSMIAKAALDSCKPGDQGGVPTDGFLTDPRDCHWDPGAIQCTGADAPTCLTAAQVGALRKMYGGARNLRTGGLIYPGWPRTSEGGWASYWSGFGKPEEPARANFWRYWGFNDPNWNWWDFDWDQDMAFVDDRLASTINAMSPDLRAFEKRGGKLIHYSGTIDPVVAMDDSIGYWKRVVAFPAQGHGIGLEGKGRTKQVQKFYRLFLVPGMGHCGGGVGPNTFDMLTALENWVEQGVAPDRIIASHSTAGKVDMTRPLCPYPEFPQYQGFGDTNDAANFICVEDKYNVTQMPAPEYLR